jgi:hypothetical protein
MHTKTKILLLMCALAVIEGVLLQAFFIDSPSSAPPRLAWLLPYSFLLFWWYCVDAEQRNYARSGWMNYGIILLAIVALPYYFFRTRGFARGLLANLLAVLTLALSLAMNIAGAMLVYLGFQA